MSEWLDGFSMAWGMFLAIPCPLRRWNEKAREKMRVCLPLVGLAGGGIWLGLSLLLRHAAIGVAMGNAVDEVKEHANYITTSVDEDGVANALKHFSII